MKKRYVGYAVWLILACLLYFFENNTGTRIVLACSWMLPFLPVIRRSLFEKDTASQQPKSISQTIKTFAARAEDVPGDVRAYLPGDSVNRIHWKLSAKRDVLLVREQAMEKTMEEAESQAVSEDGLSERHPIKKPLFQIVFSALLLALILLLAIPLAWQGTKALLNRLFAASEAVNAYAYERLTVPADQPVWLSAFLLGLALLSLLGLALLSGSRLLALCLMAGCVLFQVYFGLAFPAWVNVSLFVLHVLWMIRRPWEKAAVLAAAAGIAAVSFTVLLICPGVDAATETASESVRDRLSQIAQSITGVAQELPAGENEARRAHTQSLITGNQEARPDREYRLVTAEEKQISMPHWVNYLRIVLLLLLAVALVVFPFLPFAVLNRRRKKALEARQAFLSEDISEAITAIFQHVTAWLEATGNGEGNLPYAQWRADISPGYAERFAPCEKLFEEAAYSTHEMREEQRQQMLDLLNETERILQRKAGWKQRLRLRYKECLWV